MVQRKQTASNSSGGKAINKELAEKATCLAANKKKML